jgi:hypothetical protein
MARAKPTLGNLPDADVKLDATSTGRPRSTS